MRTSECALPTVGSLLAPALWWNQGLAKGWVAHGETEAQSRFGIEP